MKPFNLELAKAGRPVCTRDGHDARIICFDKKDKECHICALIDNGKTEYVYVYDNDGCVFGSDGQCVEDLMMKSTKKKEGWINIYGGLVRQTSMNVYDTKEEAFKNRCSIDYLDTIKIEWEE